MDEMIALRRKHHATAHRYFIPDHVWHIVALAHPWASQNKNMAQASLSTVLVSPPPCLKHIIAGVKSKNYFTDATRN